MPGKNAGDSVNQIKIRVKAMLIAPLHKMGL